MSEANASAEPTSHALGATNGTTLSELHALIEAWRGKKKWPPEAAKAAEEMMAAVMLSPASAQPELGNILSLAQDLPIVIIEGLFEKCWKTLPADRREQLVSEVLKLTSEKSQTRKAAIAEKIARTDGRSAAYIVQGLISSGKKGKETDFWPQLSKERKDLLRSRFGNKEWVYFNEPEEPLMRVLLAGLFEAMTESDGGKGKKSQRPRYDFARWALSTVKRVNIDVADRNLITEKVLEIGKDFPLEWKRELAVLSGAVPSGSADHLPSSPSVVAQQVPTIQNEVTSDDDEIRTTARRVDDARPDAPADAPLDAPPDAVRNGPLSDAFVPETKTARSMSEGSFAAAITALVKRKQTEVEVRNVSIELLQNDVRYVASEVRLLRQLLDALENSETAKNELESEVRQITRKADGLKSAISQVEQELASTRKAQETADELSKSLAHEKHELQQALEEEKGSRTSERQELEKEIQRTAQVTLDGFKAKLARSLRPIFTNKRTTDDQEPSARLSEFLRSWLDQIEAKLNEFGVDISKDG